MNISQDSINNTANFNSNNIQYYTVDSIKKREREEAELNHLLDLYCDRKFRELYFDLDEIIVSTEEYLNLKN
jgi:hypothetical protein